MSKPDVMEKLLLLWFKEQGPKTKLQLIQKLLHIVSEEWNAAEAAEYGKKMER